LRLNIASEDSRDEVILKSNAGGQRRKQVPKMGSARGLQPIQMKNSLATETTQQQQHNLRCLRSEGRSRVPMFQDDIMEDNSLMKGSNESRKEVRAWMRGILTTKNITRIETWNVRTAYDTRRLAQIFNEMKRYQDTT
jgi:hypothetical protein